MNYRFKSLLLVLLLVCNADSLWATPNMYMISHFENESISRSPTRGNRITIGFGNEALYGTASFRVLSTDTNMTLHIAQRVHGESFLTGYFLGNLAYLSYGLHSGTTSLVAAYNLRASTTNKKLPTLFSAGIGLHGKNSWSRSYDNTLWDIDPHISFSVTQGFSDQLYVNMFVTTDALCMPDNNLSNWYGMAVTMALTKNLMVQVRPLVRFSDFSNESRFVTQHEISCSVCWSEAPHRKHWMQESGVWL